MGINPTLMPFNYVNKRAQLRRRMSSPAVVYRDIAADKGEFSAVEQVEALLRHTITIQRLFRGHYHRKSLQLDVEMLIAIYADARCASALPDKQYSPIHLHYSSCNAAAIAIAKNLQHTACELVYAYTQLSSSSSTTCTYEGLLIAAHAPSSSMALFTSETAAMSAL
eukprot:3385-Heterococcus_DN1.PRE.4